MMKVGVMATYPARAETLEQNVHSILPQLDKLHLVLNEYTSIPSWVQRHGQLSPMIPEFNLKDMGKFLFSIDDNDFVFLLDDDIIYPNDYVDYLTEKITALSAFDVVVGVHGVIYSDYFDGRHTSRIVHPFFLGLERDTVVNQLGTGTVCCRGRHLPDFAYMEGSEFFVDVRFARYLHRKDVSSVCVAREKGWMSQLQSEQLDSIFLNYTNNPQNHIIREVQNFGGFSKLSVNLQKHLRFR